MFGEGISVLRSSPPADLASVEAGFDTYRQHPTKNAAESIRGQFSSRCSRNWYKLPHVTAPTGRAVAAWGVASLPRSGERSATPGTPLRKKTKPHRGALMEMGRGPSGLGLMWAGVPRPSSACGGLRPRLPQRGPVGLKKTGYHMLTMRMRDTGILCCRLEKAERKRGRVC